VERELKGGEEHRYPLSLAAGEFVNVEVVAQGITPQVLLLDAQGQSLAFGRFERDVSSAPELAFLTSATAAYQLVLRTAGPATKAGKYTLTVNALRAATEQDRHYAAAHQLSQAGVELIYKRTAEGRRQGLVKIQEALPHWQASGVLTAELEARRIISDTRFVLGEFRPALAMAKELLAKAQSAGLRRWELTGLKYVGALHNSLNDYASAQQTLEQALVLSRALRERLEERAILNSLGIAVAQLGLPHTAIRYYQESLVIAREIRDRAGEATLLRNLAVRYQDIGEPEQALSLLQQSLTLRRELGLRDTEATAMLELSRLQLRLGEMQAAVELASQAQEKLRAAGRQDDEASAFLHRGRVYYEMQEFQLAAADLKQSLALYRRTENRRQLANGLRLLGSIERRQGNTAEAHKLLEEAITLHRSLNLLNDLGDDLTQLGAEYIAQGQPQQALVPLAEALTLNRQQSSLLGEAHALLQLSRAERALGENEKSTASLQQALTLSRTGKTRLLEAEILHDLARHLLQQGRFAEAQMQIESALNITEQARRNLVNPATRAEYRSRQQSDYEIYIETLLRRHEQEGNEKFAVQALAAVEQSRARSLLDLLSESQVDIRRGVAPELLAHERSLRQRLAAKTELVSQLIGRKARQEQVKLLEAEITKLTADLTEAETRIRVASPAYAALTQPPPLTLEAMQKQVLDPDTALLEYALGTERSYVFVVTQTSLKAFSLPKRAEIETATRHWLERLRQREQAPAFPNIAAAQKWLAQVDKETTLAAATVGRMILQPIAAELARKRLMIVPDGVLHYVPFAALPKPVVGGQWSVVRKGADTNRQSVTGSSKQTIPNRPPPTDHRPPLIVYHELLTLPSASTLAVLRQEFAERKPAPKMLAVVADPVFSATDDRVRAAGQPPLVAAVAASSAPPTRAWQVLASTTEPTVIPRLPASRAEAEAILALVPAEARKVALDFAANQMLAQSAELGQYRYVHFATHSLLHPTQPQLSGLLLSLVDEAGKPQPGFLNAQAIFQLKLPAELVVLSACQTALGKEMPGEGLIGLTRGFMYAGAKRVIASLWRVSDEATAELMKSFYQELLRNPVTTPAAALRAAQIKVSRIPRWRTPYYWAGFVLQGEW